MKKIIICLLLGSIIFSFIACGTQTKFSEFQGTWSYQDDVFADRKIRINDAQVYMQIGTQSEFSIGLELIKENGKYYVLYSGGEKEAISLSNDGKELTFQGYVYRKQ